MNTDKTEKLDALFICEICDHLCPIVLSYLMTAKHRSLTDQIIAAFYSVYNALGYGYLEKVYENAMVLELRHRNLEVQPQAPIIVRYRGQVVGEYYADLLVAGKVIVELKAAKDLAPEHEAQLLNYLQATSIEVGLLLNFGPEPTVKRKVYDNERKRVAWQSEKSLDTDCTDEHR